jgi:hypothetical protein
MYNFTGGREVEEGVGCDVCATAYEDVSTKGKASRNRRIEDLLRLGMLRDYKMHTSPD